MSGGRVRVKVRLDYAVTLDGRSCVAHAPSSECKKLKHSALTDLDTAWASLVRMPRHMVRFFNLLVRQLTEARGMFCWRAWGTEVGR